ncbi:MAG: multidrug effflux MFS transporter [Burkholderiaceae bacterium]
MSAVTPSSLASTSRAATPFLVWLLAGLMALQPLATDFYLPTLPAIAAAFGAPVAAAQWTLSAFVIAVGVWQLIAGPLSDCYGRLPVMLGGVAIYGVGALVCMAAPALEVLIVGRVLQGVGVCSIMVAGRGVVRDVFAPQDGARVLAAAGTIMSIAPLVSPLLGAGLLAVAGWRAVFAALALISAGLLALAWRRLAETNLKRDRRALAWQPMLSTYRRLLASPGFRAYALTSASTYGGLFAFISGSSFVLIRVLGLSAMAMAISFGLMVSGYLLGSFACQRLLRRRGIQRTVYLGAGLQLVAGAAMLAFALAGVHHAAAIVVPMMIFGVSHGLLQPPSQAGVMAEFPVNAGAAAALSGAITMLAASLIGGLMGATYDGSVYPMVLTISLISLTTFTLANILVRRDGAIAH